MDAALREFRLSMCVEHIDEAACLYDLCDARQRDPLSDWLLVQPFERRLDLHLDALVVGGDAATQACSQALAAADDAGACHAAAATWALRAETQRLDTLWQGAAEAPGDDEASALPGRQAVDRAMARALSEYLPQSALRRFAKAAAAWAADGQHAGWTVLARRRVDTLGLLQQQIQVTAQSAPLGLLQAAADCPDRIDPDAARPWYTSDDPATATAALRAGLLRGCGLALSTVRGDTMPPSPVLLALVRGRSAVKPLVKALADPAGAQAAVALGVLGDLSAVRHLVSAMAKPALSAWCAQALYVITGLAPREIAHVPDPVAEDELFDQELQAWRRDGSVPKAADGLSFGNHEDRLCQDAAIWRDLLHQHAGAFVAGTRYRFGKPCAPRVMLDGLLMPGLGSAFRGPFADELRLRHGIDLAIDASTPVQTQMRRIHRALAALPTVSAQVPGRWWLGAHEADA